MSAPRLITASQWWAAVARTAETLAEFVGRAKRADQEEHGHDCGHQFEVTVRSCLHSSGVAGETPPVHSDANWWSEPATVTVRAHNQRDALLQAALTVPLAQWHPEDEEKDS